MIAPTRLARTAWLAAALLATSGASAQYDPARVQVEPPAVAARFAAPAERYDTPAFDAAQACGLLGERGDIRCGKKRRALPQVGVIALGVVSSLPAAVGWNELKRNSFIELLLRSLAGLKHCKGAAHLVASHE